MISNVFSIEGSGTELLSALLNHTITHRNLVEQVADKLSGREAAALIDRLVALIDMQELDVDRYRNVSIFRFVNDFFYEYWRAYFSRQMIHTG